MKLEKLNLSRDWNDTTKLRGSIEFSNELGKIELRLDAETSRQILAVCADALVRISQKAANEMSARVIDALTEPQVLEAPSHDD